MTVVKMHFADGHLEILAVTIYRASGDCCKAMKQYPCAACPEPIHPGENYVYNFKRNQERQGPKKIQFYFHSAHTELS